MLTCQGLPVSGTIRRTSAQKEVPMRHRLSVLRISAFVSLLLTAAALSAEPRPISGAEREAVRIAADYLSRGPAAIVDNLAASSPLRKLSRSDQLAEIEARL